MFLRTLMCGQSAYDWKTIPIWRLLGATSMPCAASYTTRSPNAMCPSSAVSSPARQRRVVVFPHPLGPSRTRNSPGSISRSSASIAVVGVLPPKRLESPRIVIRATFVTSQPVVAARTWANEPSCGGERAARAPGSRRFSRPSDA